MLRMNDPMVLAASLASQCEDGLRADEEAPALAKLSEVFRSALSDDLEYIVLMSPEGRTHIHTNKLREGRVYQDPTSLAAAALREPTLQTYERNTGEVIREAVVPVGRAGQHYAVLRVGQIVQRGSARARIAGSLVATATMSALGALAVAGPAAAAIALAAGLLSATGLAVWNWRRISRVLASYHAAARAVMGGDLTAEVTGAGRDELGQLGFEFNKVVLGLQKAIQAGVTSSRRTHELSERIVGGTRGTTDALARITATVGEVARGAGEQAAATGEVSQTLDEMMLGIRAVAATGERVAAEADESRRAAEAGATVVLEATEAMARVERGVVEAASALDALGTSSQAIDEIVRTIRQIVDQTTLLALNAAIEAARAGSEGRGFAVVAEEVRRLAESTRAEAASIADLIAGAQGDAQRAMELMSRSRQEATVGSAKVAAAGEAFDDIRVHVLGLSGGVETVAAEAQELSAGASEVVRALMAVAAVSDENAGASEEVAHDVQHSLASSQEVAGSAEELNRSVADLSELVGRFRLPSR